MSNRQFEQVNKLVHQAGKKLDECPTCRSRMIEVAPGVEGRDRGTYKFRDVEYPCDCETQIALYRHYLLAGIGDQYMRLNWAEFTGTEETRETVGLFLENWENFKQHGMGLEFSSPNQGVGKTFAATHIARELVKFGERVKFVTFLDVMSGYQREDAEAFDDELRNTTWLVLDEVRPPWTGAMGNLFSNSFEALIRHRQNFNRPVIMTTNLIPDELREHYERTYSLLAAKQVRVEMSGEDVRQTKLDLENFELVLNGEIRPIT